jgi:hypothetical protein
VCRKARVVTENDLKEAIPMKFPEFPKLKIKILEQIAPTIDEDDGLGPQIFKVKYAPYSDPVVMKRIPIFNFSR